MKVSLNILYLYLANWTNLLKVSLNILYLYLANWTNLRAVHWTIEAKNHTLWDISRARKLILNDVSLFYATNFFSKLPTVKFKVVKFVKSIKLNLIWLREPHKVQTSNSNSRTVVVTIILKGIFRATLPLCYDDVSNSWVRFRLHVTFSFFQTIYIFQPDKLSAKVHKDRLFIRRFGSMSEAWKAHLPFPFGCNWKS